MRPSDDELSVVRLPIDASDPVQRRLVEAVFNAAFAIRTAVQRDARDRLRAYSAAVHERKSHGRKGPATVRDRLGLSRNALERAAYGHLDGAPHLRRFATKALAMHIAANVWTSVEAHLFGDADGKRRGCPHVGHWFDFTRIPGRARSHTKPRVWETFRLVGSLAGHRAAYTGADGRFGQPRHLHHIPTTDSWWTYEGPLAIVFTGLTGGTLTIPVRLPSAPSNQAHLDHHLADPSRWHKVDLIRHRDPNAAGGWRYEAHLMVLVAPYVSPSVARRRETVVFETTKRTAGIDVNVSNITVASHVDGADLRIDRVERSVRIKRRDHRRKRHDRRRDRRLDRSRRAANPAQYNLSLRQERLAREREEQGRPPRQVIPRGSRKAHANKKPMQAYRKDELSASYRHQRAAIAADAAAKTQARQAEAQTVAGELVRDHGVRFVIENCNVRTWARRWGSGIAAFAPSTFTAALEREVEAVMRLGVTGGVVRASTKTALSQHCLCGARKHKPLSQRVHICTVCGLRGDRDAVSATLAAFVVVSDPLDPSTARLDVAASRAALERPQTLDALASTLPVSTSWVARHPVEISAQSDQGDSFVEDHGRMSHDDVVGARRSGTAPRSTPDETGEIQTTSVRIRMRHHTSQGGDPPLRDKS